MTIRKRHEVNIGKVEVLTTIAEQLREEYRYSPHEALIKKLDDIAVAIYEARKEFSTVLHLERQA